ncbi:hypothetical protein VIOR3934_15736 [Vibrio orientalis CIP 102891 = ATCC 33934]|uniref:Uncharacterized protein n=1 Tax=Vibrio orientalis CIP 102891 = ATCC 33934 TaxID=675816 RepID=C9QJ25_VIBOR|nr:hypothetical protein VIA_002226 [Vibrio orientalis CIP 102891 = ATCC 33934]EGU47193.1 hypothetical protein VIOR3934_15736 [Vibrio orientalis CIP 102891 = ATCC 33934]
MGSKNSQISCLTYSFKKKKDEHLFAESDLSTGLLVMKKQKAQRELGLE